MADITVRTRAGAEIQVRTVAGHSVMELIRDAGIDELMALCGGSCSCATCHVYVDGDAGHGFPLASDDEDELLDSSPHRRENSRLSCQLFPTDAHQRLRVTIAPED